MNLKPVVLMIAAAILAAGLVGCGGGGPGSSEPTGVTLTISADTEWSETRSVTSRATTMIAPLADEGSLVVAYDYSTGLEVARGTLTLGTCKLNVTPGLTIVVVITGKSGGKDYRLSTIIPDVPIADAEVVADPATTIAAEAIAQKHPIGSGTVLDDATFGDVLGEATAYVAANADEDFSLTGGLIGGTAFGGAGSIVVAEIPDVVAAVPDVINSNLVQAKNAVQQIKEAGVPLMAMTAQEIPDAEGIFTDEVIDKYKAFAAGLDESVMGTLLMGSWDSVQLDGSDVHYSDIPLGRTYTGVLSGGVLTLTDADADTAGRYTIVTEVDALTRTVVAVKSGIQWTINETVSDGSAEYSASFPDTGHEPGLNPSFTADISLKNEAFPTAVTFEGTASAVGAGKAAYTKMVFDGTLTAPDFEARGRFEVNFLSELPDKAKPDAVIYDFPTSASMTNASIAATDSAGNTITLTGAISATGTTITESGDLGHTEFRPSHFALSGTYANSKSGLGFEGSITANWTNPAASYDDEMKAEANVNLHGEITRGDHPPYYEDLTVTLDNGAITSVIDLRVGGNSLKGTASATMVHEHLPYGTLTLTNQAGVQFNLALSASEVFSGSVKAGDPLTQVATITKDGDRIRIASDTDSWYEEF